MQLVLCDENRMLCEALAFVLQAHGHRVLAIATSASEGVAAVSVHQPDACLLGVLLPGGSGLDAARAMRQGHPDTKIVVLSWLSDPAVVSEAKEAGVAGFIRKDQRPDSIVRALAAVGAGGVAFGPAASRRQGRGMTAECRDNRLGRLTPRETEVLRRIVAGQSTRQMAREMGIAITTLRGYVNSILAKLGAHSRIEAAAIASAN
jgi:two-component system, NarL family, nitrate/nitrite response regulator NarL